MVLLVSSVQAQLAASITPMSETVQVGKAASFTALVGFAPAGTPPYTFTWYQGFAVLAGYSSANLVIVEPSAGSYAIYCVVTDSKNNTATTPIATLTVTAPTPTPTALPTAKPTATPTAAPTPTPTVAPTVAPTVTPTVTPTVAPTVTPSPTTSSSGLSTGDVYLIAVVVVVIIVILIVAAVVLLRKRAKP